MTINIDSLGNEAIKDVDTVELYQEFSNQTLERKRLHIKMDQAHQNNDIPKLVALGAECGITDVYLALMEAELYVRQTGEEFSATVQLGIEEVEFKHMLEEAFLEMEESLGK